MCGIAGIVGEHDEGQIEDMTATLRHRGPDDVGYYRSGALQLGMRRLSIIDLATGGQPVYNETGDKCVVFNGEIYNYRELRARLLKLGHTFRSRSDTEVIIHLYEEYGPDCVEHLRGMFAFAIADGHRLFLARDRLGIKPLYYAILRDRQRFLFASELKAILRCQHITPALDMQAFTDMTVLNHLVDRRTFFEGVKAFPPGHTMTVTLEDGRVKLEEQSYYRVELADDGDDTMESAEEKLITMLRSVVKSHLVADVEVGLTLSGGLDSSMLAMMMNESYGERIRAYTVADHATHPDVEQSKQVASKLRCSHEVVEMSFEDYLREIPHCIIAEEQPTSLFGLPFFFLCKRIGTSLKVCLNGEGADELFGGYPEYLDRSHKVMRLRKNLEIVRRRDMSPSPAAVEVIEKLSSAANFDDYLRCIFEINLRDALVRQHLEIVDKYSMAASLEARVPFMDHELVEFVNRLPLRLKVDRALRIPKYILKRAVLRAYGLSLADVVLREKIGFPSAGARYLSRFDELCERLLPADYLERHELGHCFSRKRQLLLFDLFRELFLKRGGSASANFSVLEFMKESASG